MSKTVDLIRFYPAKAERLFDYFLRRHQLENWFYPAEMVAHITDFSPLEGGALCYELLGKDGTWTATGQFEEITLYERLVLLTSELRDPDGQVAMKNLRTVIEFFPHDGGSRLHLTETGHFSTDAALASEISWNQRLSLLMGLVDEANAGNVVEAEPRVLSPL